MAADEEDFVYFGTPIEREEDITSRRKKAVAEASGNLRSVPAWKQEVTDEEGRRRFHGAFTGGFSAGYYNTVGSKEGWAPQTFTSSRKNRAEVKQQSIFSFLDEDEKSEMDGQFLGTTSQFDTFGFTAAELSRKQAEKEQKQRPSAIPGPVPDELVAPAAEAIGVKLLMKMGWRRGRSIKESNASALYDARREARRAFLAFADDGQASQRADPDSLEGDAETFVNQTVNDPTQSSQSTPIYVLSPKQDLHGLGYDPYKHAPEFREKKRLRSGNKEPGFSKHLSVKDILGSKSGKAAPGFGIGALEDFDAEDEDLYGSDYNFVETYIQEDEEPVTSLCIESKQKPLKKESGVLPGFKVSTNSDYHPERFDAPVVPKDFVPHHKFLASLDAEKKIDLSPCPEVPPPENNDLKVLIEGVATLVARCGKIFEDLSREKNQSNPLFSFLSGGNGHEYYARKLWEERQKRGDQTKLLLDEKNSPSIQKMTADGRGKLLGERPLERSERENSSTSVSSRISVNLQHDLSNTFNQPALFNELPEDAKPFKDDPAKQERFEQFLKEKYRGGLRTTDSGAAGHMSEAARARERLDFESAAEAIEKGKRAKESKIAMPQFMEFSAAGGLKFTSGGTEQVGVPQAEDLTVKKIYPRREEFQWRPSPILCKRFDLIDPFMGKPPPAPRTRSKMDSLDSLIFMSDSDKPTKTNEDAAANRDFPSNQNDSQKITGNEAEQEVEIEVENVDRPVDLYKAIFSDDSDDEMAEADTNNNKVVDPEKKVEAATSTLNRLIAGDFLESLGKELGLEVPPDMPPPPPLPPQGATPKPDTGTALVKGRTSISQDVAFSPESKSPDNPLRNGSKEIEGLFKNSAGKVDLEKMAEEDRKHKSSSRHRRKRSSDDSSEDEGSRKRSRRHRHKSNDSYSDSSSDSSGDDRDRYRSRSDRKKKRSSKEKSGSSKRHSKRHKRRSKESPSRSSRYDSGKKHSETRKERRK